MKFVDAVALHPMEILHAQEGRISHTPIWKMPARVESGDIMCFKSKFEDDKSKY